MGAGCRTGAGHEPLSQRRVRVPPGSAPPARSVALSEVAGSLQERSCAPDTHVAGSRASKAPPQPWRSGRLLLRQPPFAARHRSARSGCRLRAVDRCAQVLGNAPPDRATWRAGVRTDGNEMTADELFDPTQVDLVALSPDGRRLSSTSSRRLRGQAQTPGSARCRTRFTPTSALPWMAQAHPEAASLPWLIVIRCLSGGPDPRTADVLARTTEPSRGYGGDLAIRT